MFVLYNFNLSHFFTIHLFLGTFFWFRGINFFIISVCCVYKRETEQEKERTKILWNLLQCWFIDFVRYILWFCVASKWRAKDASFVFLKSIVASAAVVLSFFACYFFHRTYPIFHKATTSPAPVIDAMTWSYVQYGFSFFLIFFSYFFLLG